MRYQVDCSQWNQQLLMQGLKGCFLKFSLFCGEWSSEQLKYVWNKCLRFCSFDMGNPFMLCWENSSSVFSIPVPPFPCLALGSIPSQQTWLIYGNTWNLRTIITDVQGQNNHTDANCSLHHSCILHSNKTALQNVWSKPTPLLQYLDGERKDDFVVKFSDLTM